MIVLDKLQGHVDMCGGYSCSGTVSFDGSTVAEVLREIQEYSKDKQAAYIGDGFGNPQSKMCDAWGIKINDVPYVGNWVGWKNEYRGEYDEEKVIEVRVSGGWCCFYSFDIISEKTKKSQDKISANKMLDDEAAELEKEKTLKKLFKL